jgi:hypothetical protein|tara:strand:+ start:95 stop:769 length:675 start_codon:yes stop_codon:yes gene_type:complete
MATSGTFTWRPDIEEIIVEAYERCGVDAQILTGYQARAARRSLNLMFTSWGTKGVNYWTTSQVSETVTESTATITLDVGTIDVLDAVLRRSNTDTPMQRISMSEYHQLPTKTTEGLPSSFFFDRQYTPQIYLWPVPENSTDAFVYWQLKQIEDVTASNQDADVPYRWTEAMVSGLAVRLCTKQKTIDVNRLTVLKEQEIEAFRDASDDEGEKSNLRIIPPRQMW